MKYNIIYNGAIVSVVDIQPEELDNYTKVLANNLPLATMESVGQPITAYVQKKESTSNGRKSNTGNRSRAGR
jgi:hypothetical protein